MPRAWHSVKESLGVSVGSGGGFEKDKSGLAGPSCTVHG